MPRAMGSSLPQGRVRLRLTVKQAAVLAVCVMLGCSITVTRCTADDRERAKDEPAAAAEQAGSDGAVAKQVDAAQDREAKPDEPQPTGKLGIRKGTGRPAGLPVVEAAAPARRNQVEAAMVFDALVEEPDDDAAALELMRKEKAAELRPLLHAELYFIHLVCHTNRQERQRLLAAAEPELDKVVTIAARRALADPEGHAMAIQMRGGRQLPQQQRPQPLEILRERLLALAEEHLDQDRCERLRHEMKLRTEAQRRVAVGNVIAHLDTALLLSPQQQEELVPLLLAGWREEWQSIPQHVNAAYTPEMSLPPAVLTQFTDEQRKRWQALPRVHFFAGHQRLGGRAEGGDRWKAALEELDRAKPQPQTDPSLPAEQEDQQSQ